MSKVKSNIFGILLLPVLLAGQPLEQIPIATVGSLTITDKEFLSRYELTPGLQRKKNQTEMNKAEFLVSLIAEKLLLLKAKQEGWENDSTVNGYIAEVEKLLVRDELYRREVSQRISISDSEIRNASNYARNDLKIYFLYARTKKGADSLHAQIKRGKALESFSFDPNVRDELSGPDSAIARWGDVDQRMESVIYSLKLNETSTPVELDDGWYIAKVMGKTTTIIAGEKEQAAIREKVTTILRQRKEKARMMEFMASELKSRKANVNAKIMKSVILHLWDDVQKKNPSGSDTALYVVDESSLEYLRSVLRDSMQAQFVSFSHTTWTVEQSLEKIKETALAIVRPTLATVRIDIEQRLREVIDQEFLALIGYERGLHRTRAVRDELHVWRDAYRAQFVRGRIQDTVSVSAYDIEEVKKIFREDSAIVNNNEEAKERALELKSVNAVDRVAAGIANSERITIYQQNLQALQVTDTPSMVFRYLGFGGRMFAVPFVVPQTGWINYWEQKRIILP